MKHKTSIQIRFKDIDKLGHVNNANHLSYIELARVRYFDEVLGMGIDWSKEGVILARIEIDYLLPITMDHQVYVYTQCSRMGNTSIDLNWKIIKDENGKETDLARGKAVLVAYDYTAGKSVAVPKEWREKIERYERPHPRPTEQPFGRA